MMGISAGALFPGLDGICADLKDLNFGAALREVELSGTARSQTVGSDENLEGGS